MNVTIYMWPYDILYVNEARGAIKISGWIDLVPAPVSVCPCRKCGRGSVQRWKDPFLTWDPADYGGVENTHLPSKAVWLPIVDLFYSKEDVKVAQRCIECPVRTDYKGPTPTLALPFSSRLFTGTSCRERPAGVLLQLQLPLQHQRQVGRRREAGGGKCGRGKGAGTSRSTISGARWSWPTGTWTTR